MDLDKMRLRYQRKTNVMAIIGCLVALIATIPLLVLIFL